MAVDIWSAGVIAFILLGGYPPFQSDDDNRDALFAVIKTGKFKFHSQYWKNISAGAKEFIKAMLTLGPFERPTAKECLAHAWLNADAAKLGADLAGTTLPALKEFNAKRKLKATMATVKAMRAFQMVGK